MILKTRIRGIPCLVSVTHYEPGLEPSTSGNPDNWDPGYPPEVEFEVLDLQGRPAPWLERKMDDCDTRAIEQEIITAKQKEKQQALEDLAEEHHFEEHFA